LIGLIELLNSGYWLLVAGTSNFGLPTSDLLVELIGYWVIELSGYLGFGVPVATEDVEDFHFSEIPVLRSHDFFRTVVW